jgi:lincosamide nucleotidyltransferase B/F
MRFIQGYAVDRILELSEEIKTPTVTSSDLFNLERRFEQRFPDTARALPEFLQGYEKNRESALAVLTFLDMHFEINLSMKRAVLRLCQHGMSGEQPS